MITRGQERAVQEGTAHAATARQPAAVLERWELAGPFPTTMGTTPDRTSTPFVSMLRARADQSGGRVVVSEAMQCAARELGRYLLAHDGNAPQPLSDFVSARCGSAGTFQGAWLSRGSDTSNADEATLVAHYQRDLTSALQSFMPTGDALANVGGWFGRDGARFMFLLAMESRRSQVDPRPYTTDPDGRVTIEGRVLEPTAHVMGLINHGAWAAEECEFDASVRLPRFRVRCPLAQGDTAARVDISITPPGRLLGHTVFSALVGPGRDASRTFEVRASEPALVAHDTANATTALLTALNDARSHAGIPPVRLADDETAAVCRAAPAYFSLMLEGTASPAVDQIALGLMAGWDVNGGMIREGTFFAAGGAEEDDAGRWLAWALERPLARRMLLERNTQQVAMCPWMLGEHAHGVVWASYRFFTDGTEAQELGQVYARIDAQRRARGLPTMTRLSSLEPTLQSQAQSMARGQGALEPTLHAMLERATDSTGQGVRGWVIPTTELNSIEFPREITEAPTLRMAAALVHWRAPDDAWGQTVVFAVIAQ